MTCRRNAFALVPALALGLAACSTDAPGSDLPDPSTPPAPTTAPPPPPPTVTAPPPPPPTTSAPAPTQTSPTPTQPEPALASHGVAAGNPQAADAGMQVLTAGGSAVDAAIAAAFADAVTQPSSSGIGGGGVALVLTDGEAVSYDYREVVNQEGVIPDDGVGAPGFVAGMQLLHQEHGELPWADLLEPAIELADDGALVSDFFAGALTSPLGSQAIAAHDHFHRGDGSPLRAGDELVQADLAQTLRQIADSPDTLYTGTIADELAQIPGLDHGTLENYEVQVSTPVEGAFGDYIVLGASPAVPGAAVIQMLQVAEAGGIADLDPGSAPYADLQTQAWQIAERTVQDDLGDPAFVDVDVEPMVDPAVNAGLADNLQGRSGPQAGAHSSATAPDAPNTTHISVVDADGAAVSMTNTITNYFGSGRYVSGFFVNDSLTRFGEIGTGENNTPQPGRRSITWSSPMMVMDDDRRPVLVLGTPGGIQIPNILATVITRWGLHGQELSEAIPAGRFVLRDGELLLEDDAAAAELTGFGYAVRALGQHEIFGSVQAIEVDWSTGELTSEVDPRRSAGFVIDPVD